MDENKLDVTGCLEKITDLKTTVLEFEELLTKKYAEANNEESSVMLDKFRVLIDTLQKQVALLKKDSHKLFRKSIQSQDSSDANNSIDEIPEGTIANNDVVEGHVSPDLFDQSHDGNCVVSDRCIEDSNTIDKDQGEKDIITEAQRNHKRKEDDNEESSVDSADDSVKKNHVRGEVENEKANNIESKDIGVDAESSTTNIEEPTSDLPGSESPEDKDDSEKSNDKDENSKNNEKSDNKLLRKNYIKVINIQQLVSPTTQAVSKSQSPSQPKKKTVTFDSSVIILSSEDEDGKGRTAELKDEQTEKTQESSDSENEKENKRKNKAKSLRKRRKDESDTPVEDSDDNSRKHRSKRSCTEEKHHSRKRSKEKSSRSSNKKRVIVISDESSDEENSSGENGNDKNEVRNKHHKKSIKKPIRIKIDNLAKKVIPDSDDELSMDELNSGKSKNKNKSSSIYKYPINPEDDTKFNSEPYISLVRYPCERLKEYYKDKPEMFDTKRTMKLTTKRKRSGHEHSSTSKKSSSDSDKPHSKKRNTKKDKATTSIELSDSDSVISLKKDVYIPLKPIPVEKLLTGKKSVHQEAMDVDEIQDKVADTDNNSVKNNDHDEEKSHKKKKNKDKIQHKEIDDDSSTKNDNEKEKSHKRKKHKDEVRDKVGETDANSSTNKDHEKEKEKSHKKKKNKDEARDKVGERDANSSKNNEHEKEKEKSHKKKKNEDEVQDTVETDANSSTNNDREEEEEGSPKMKKNKDTDVDNSETNKDDSVESTDKNKVVYSNKKDDNESSTLVDEKSEESENELHKESNDACINDNEKSDSESTEINKKQVNVEKESDQICEKETEEVSLTNEESEKETEEVSLTNEDSEKETPSTNEEQHENKNVSDNENNKTEISNNVEENQDEKEKSDTECASESNAEDKQHRDDTDVEKTEPDSQEDCESKEQSEDASDKSGSELDNTKRKKSKSDKKGKDDDSEKEDSDENSDSDSGNTKKKKDGNNKAKGKTDSDDTDVENTEADSQEDADCKEQSEDPSDKSESELENTKRKKSKSDKKCKDDESGKEDSDGDSDSDSGNTKKKKDGEKDGNNKAKRKTDSDHESSSEKQESDDEDNSKKKDDSDSDKNNADHAENGKNSDSDESDSDYKKKKNTKSKTKKITTINISSTDSEEDFGKFCKKKEKSKKKMMSDSSEDDSRNKRKKRKLRMRSKVVTSDSDSDYSKKSDSDSRNSDSSSSQSEKTKKKETKDQKSASRKRIQTIEDSSSDDDGDDRKTRKNIRKVLGRDSLSESTKKAEAEEKERKARILEKQKKYNDMFSTPEQQAVKIDKLVLDFDEKTKEELLRVDDDIVEKLKPHQASGIQFMWDACFESVARAKKTVGSGCILAHCMGLGKTLQVVAFTHTLLLNEEKTGVKKVLVVCPVNTVLNWQAEYKKWLPDEDDFEVYELASCKANERQYEIQNWNNTGGVMIIGYSMFRILSNADNKRVNKKMRNLYQSAFVDPGPDLVVCDEGHLLKNEKSHLSKAMNQIKTLRRIVLTGTPLQNNLKEYFCMVQFIKPNLLGTYREYLNRFVNPITNGQYTDSTPHDIEIMRKRSHVLHKLLDGVVQRKDYSVLAPYLPQKHEYVLFLSLTELQIKLYDHYLLNFAQRGSNCRTSKKNTSFLFLDFQEMQGICSHPRILADRKINKENREMMRDDDDEEEDSEGSLKDFIVDNDTTSSSSSSASGEEDGSGNSDEEKEKKKNKTTRKRLTRATAAASKEEEIIDLDMIEESKRTTGWWTQYCSNDEFEDVKNSSKLLLLFNILKECEQMGDKVLVFSQSLYSLTVIEYFLEKIDAATQDGNDHGGFTGSWAIGLDYFRLDGSSSCDNRASWCNTFNDPRNTRARLFLISTRAGGLGINLVAANRVIIFDVSWNPSHDIQSIYRVYRFGQIKPCYIYRFVTYGTMEMKIYERQVTKQAISKRVIDEQQIDRHYNQHDLAELYKFEPTMEDRPTPLVPKDVLLGELLQKYDEQILSYHEHQSLLENKEDEELDEETRKAAWEEFENEKVLRRTYNTGLNLGGVSGAGGVVMTPHAVTAALTSLVRRDNPTWNAQQIKAMLPVLVRELEQQVQSGIMTMYHRIQKEIQLMNAAQEQKMREHWMQQQMFRIHQQQQAAIINDPHLTPELRKARLNQLMYNQWRSNYSGAGSTNAVPFNINPSLPSEIIDLND